MRSRLEALERLSRCLDPSEETRRQMLKAVQDYSEAFLNALPESGTYRRDRGRRGLEAAMITEHSTDLPGLLTQFREEVDTTGITPDEAAREVLLYLGHKGYI